jgi:hypothetical protein
MRNSWLMVLVLGCSDGGPKSASGLIDPTTGGMVSIANGSAAVIVGPGALSTATRITITSDSTAVPTALGAPVSSCFLFQPEGQQFNHPVTITLAIDPAKLPQGRTIDDVFIATAPAGSPSFSALTTSVSDQTHVAAESAHFSLFCAVAPIAEDAAVPSDLAGEDLSASMDLAQTDQASGDLASPAPSCSPYPTPSPSPFCMFGPVPSNFNGCGWLIQCGSASIPYEVNCDTTTCSCYHNNVVVDSFPKGTYCDIQDGGTNTPAWERCCFPQ